MNYAIARAVFGFIQPETAHHLSILALKLGLGGRSTETDAPVLATRVWDLQFANPIGMAAGYDKGAEVMDPLLDLGFGFVEAGTVTPLPQPGNPKPRLFRLDEDSGVINRLGFNSGGLAPYLERISRRPRGRGVFGANVGKNRDATDAVADYVTGITAVCRHADYLVTNISSPNTPGLRALQGREQIEELLEAVLKARNAAAAGGRRPPLLAKVGPDLTDEAVADIAEIALKSGVDGLIIGNTTIDRPASLKSPQAHEAGGLSGRPLTAKATACLAAMYRHTGGRLPLIGCGGVESGADAYAKIRAGASLVQLYSALVFHGPDLVARIKRDLAALLRADGFTSVAQAVGADER